MTRKSKSSCIYKITNIINGKFYIGSTIHYNIRINCHFSSLRKKRHNNEYLQNAFNKYGEENFISEILEICEPSRLREIEQLYLDKFKPQYNIQKLSVLRKTDIIGSKKSKLNTEQLKSFREKMKAARGRNCPLCGQYNRKEIIEEDKEGNIREWSSVSEATRFYNDQNIWKVLKGIRKSASKRKWKYKQ